MSTKGTFTKGIITFGNKKIRVEIIESKLVRGVIHQSAEIDAVSLSDAVSDWLLDRFNNGDAMKIEFAYRTKGIKTKAVVYDTRIIKFRLSVSSLIRAKVKFIGTNWKMEAKCVRDLSPEKVIFT